MMLLLCLALLGSIPGDHPPAGQVQIRQEAAFEYAYVEYQGSYAAIPQAVSAFMADFFKQGLTPTSPLLGIYLNYAKDTGEADLKWQIGLGIPTGTRVNAPLKTAIFKSQEVIYVLRKGPYDTVGETYALLHKTIAEKGYLMNGPAFERYLSDPAQVAAQDLETEIFIPVKRK